MTGGAATVTDPKYNNASTFITRFSGGNPSVKPELADTLTAGAVLSARVLQGLLGLARLVPDQDQGRDRPGRHTESSTAASAGETAHCSLVTRDPGTDALTLVGDVFVNINQSKVEGVDLEASYRTNLKLFGGGQESISGRAFASWLMERLETGATGVKVDRAGQTGIEASTGVAYPYARFKLTSNLNYRNGPFSMFVQGRYLSPGTNENNPAKTAATAPTPGVSVISHNRVAGVYYVDMNLAYNFELGGRTCRSSSTSPTCSTEIRRSHLIGRRSATTRFRPTAACSMCWEDAWSWAPRSRSSARSR